MILKVYQTSKNWTAVYKSYKLQCNLSWMHVCMYLIGRHSVLPHYVALSTLQCFTSALCTLYCILISCHIALAISCLPVQVFALLPLICPTCSSAETRLHSSRCHPSIPTFRHPSSRPANQPTTLVFISPLSIPAPCCCLIIKVIDLKSDSSQWANQMSHLISESCCKHRHSQ